MKNQADGQISLLSTQSHQSHADFLSKFVQKQQSSLQETHYFEEDLIALKTLLTHPKSLI